MGTTTKQEKLQAFLMKLSDRLDFCITDFTTGEETSFNEIESAISDSSGFDTEIIYYSRAIEYLKEHDNSLHRSLEIASDMGYQPKDLNSEVLASLLASEINREEFYDLKDEIESFLEELEETEED